MATNSDNSLPQGSLDLLVLQSLAGGKRHGYQIAKHIQSTSGDVLRVEEGSLYPALHRMERRGWIASEWGLSESNRRAKYYALAPAGRAALTQETAQWHRIASVMGRVLAASGRGE